MILFALRLYWLLSRPFLRRFIATMTGLDKVRPDSSPNPRGILRAAEEYIESFPDHVKRSVLIAQAVLPVAVPSRLPEDALPRTLVRLWDLLRNQGARAVFLFRSPAGRAAHYEKVFATLSNHARKYGDDFLKSVVVLSTLKGLFGAIYLDDATTWREIGYWPYPRIGSDPDVDPSLTPPFGLPVVNPGPSPSARLLRERALSLPDIARKPDGVTTYCVIGSGAGGAAAAHEIMEICDRRGERARVVILEAGPLVTNDEFPVHALPATRDLYMNVGATLTADQSFTFRQGRCVGGSTTINNAIAIHPTGVWMSQYFRERWQHLGAELCWEALEDAYTSLVGPLNIGPIDPAVISRAASNFDRGIRASFPGIDGDRVAANLQACIGCGRCNLGCQYDAKRSMLATLVPDAVRRGAILVPEAKVERIEFDIKDGLRTARRLSVHDRDGVRYTVEADRFIIAAGAYASSKLLFHSGFFGAIDGVPTVGRRFTCNFGSPVIGRFPTLQNGWKGQQIGFVYFVPDDRMVIETAFAPPSAVGMMAPQWGADFQRLTRAYSYLAVATPTVGADQYGQIAMRDEILGGRSFQIDWSLGQEDWRRLGRAMQMCAVALFEAGAEEIYTTRFDARTITRTEYSRSPSVLDDYFAAVGPEFGFRAESGHPQGGNVIHMSPQRGVVDEHLRVHGFNNLWITDASVFPASITLNLQFSIMALAKYAAAHIASQEQTAPEYQL